METVSQETTYTTRSAGQGMIGENEKGLLNKNISRLETMRPSSSLLTPTLWMTMKYILTGTLWCLDPSSIITGKDDRHRMA